MRHTQRENIQAALALLLGPETEYHTRVRATRRLARIGPLILPLLLTTLNNYPEITAPTWPWWPPQYEHCSRLLIYLCQKAEMQLDALLHHPAISQPIGPVLWTSVMEAAGLLPHGKYETLLCEGLKADWTSVRYAAAMALATRAGQGPLQQTTLETLRSHLAEDEPFPVRLTVAYALLYSGESIALDVILQLIDPIVPAEVRKAATFILATELPTRLTVTQRERVSGLLLCLLQDHDMELALHAAHALSRIALPSVLPALSEMLTDNNPQTLIVVLTVLEEIARRKITRRLMHTHAIPIQIAPFLKVEIPELRRQACYTFAVCGGEYVAAVLGTIVLNKEHPGHIEAIEGLRLLHGVLRAPLRTNVIHWLLRVLTQQQEEVQITALDSLSYILWQASAHGQKQAWHAIQQEIIRDGSVVHLLNNPGPWVRQRAIELISMLGSYLVTAEELRPIIRRLLGTDSDSGVRACIAYVCGQAMIRWAIPELLHALTDPDEHLALTALSALGLIATRDDHIVVYAITELTYFQDERGPIVHEAQTILKKWQGLELSMVRKNLHSFS